ncbi:outer membrane beta-barrel protein [Parahaliea mediterranea]|uniref:Outer membrane beta-barrel protein n=1 Tax=Parahaliea mediterranea TaxID=651086 RepID=A0A939DHT0_9GAMM|nr:outer membrane beta-barrel protein [Parahaliea mediterranea]MBN7798370.1 outer membrane beta-barrel protein [Parahaliea mediterranea]
MPIRPRSRTVSLLAILSLAATAHADRAGFDQHRFAVQVGYFLSSWNTELRVNGESVRNPEFDLEEQLGFDEDEETYLLGFEWRIARRHKLTAGYWDFSRSASAALQRDISVGEDTYPAGVRASSSWDVTIIPITYSYAFYDTETLQLRASAGVHWTELDFGIAGRVDVGDEGGARRNSTSADTDAPLPVLGAGLRYRPWQRWELGLDGGWFGLDLDLSGGDLEGDILTGNAYVEYALTDALRAGFKYTYFDLDVGAEASSWDGGVGFEYHGPQLYLGLRF